jgi:transposase
MDKIYKSLGDILYDLVKVAIKKYHVNLNYLYIDGTRLKIYIDEETGLVKFGYSAKETSAFPQINLLLAVNDQKIPFFVNTFPGNTSDVDMFENFIKELNTKYKLLSKEIKKKYLVFDQENVRNSTITAIRRFKDKGF